LQTLLSWAFLELKFSWTTKSFEDWFKDWFPEIDQFSINQQSPLPGRQECSAAQEPAKVCQGVWVASSHGLVPFPTKNYEFLRINTSVLRMWRLAMLSNGITSGPSSMLSTRRTMGACMAKKCQEFTCHTLWKMWAMLGAANLAVDFLRWQLVTFLALADEHGLASHNGWSLWRKSICQSL
jgi:hypothetical protein